jgi:hypothetical protein
VRRVASILAATLLLGIAPAAHATPPLHGSMAAATDLYGFCFEDPGCAAFFTAGCPDALARPDGATISIAPVDRALWDKTLTFSWSDLSTAAYDAMQATVGTGFGGDMYVFLVGGCEMPPGLPSFTLTARPEGRSQAVTIPAGTRWVVAWSLPGTANVKWWAQ